MNDPVVSIKDVIEDNWTATNTSTITPVFSTGWYSSKQKLPQITFTDPAEFPQSSGTAPFLGITTNGAPHQYFVSSIDCNVWVSRAGVSINPKKCRFEFVQEIQRILLAKYAEVGDLDFIGWRGGQARVDDTVVPAVFRFAGEIGYSYLK